MKTLIITNGNIRDNKFLRQMVELHDYIICVDGAAKYLKTISHKPDLIVGDMDSILEDDLKWIESSKVPIDVYETRKDYTDTEIAIDAAIEKKSSSIMILGAIGSRIDHSLSNLFLLKKISEAGLEGLIADGDYEVSLIQKSLRLNWSKGEVVSFIPASELPVRLTLEGFEYPLTDKTIRQGTSLCVSNVVARDYPNVIIESGSLIAVRNKDLVD